MSDKKLTELIKAQDAAYELLMDNRKRFDECVMFGAKVGSRVFLMNTLADMHKAEAGLLEASSAVALRAHELEKPKRSNKPQKCILFMNTARGRVATPLQCKSIAEAVRTARDSDLFFAYRVMIGHRVVRRGYCGGGK